MKQAGAVSVGTVTDIARRLHLQLAETVRLLHSNHQKLRQNVHEAKRRYQSTKRSFDSLKAEIERRLGFRGARREAPPPRATASDVLAMLSPRQRQVLEEVISGKANKAIAFELGLSEKTVESHRARVMQKLHASSFAELIRICLLAGVDGTPKSNSTAA